MQPAGRLSEQGREGARELSIVPAEDHRLADGRGLSGAAERSRIPSLARTFRPSVPLPRPPPRRPPRAARRHSATLAPSRSTISRLTLSLGLTVYLSRSLAFPASARPPLRHIAAERARVRRVRGGGGEMRARTRSENTVISHSLPRGGRDTESRRRRRRRAYVVSPPYEKSSSDFR